MKKQIGSLISCVLTTSTEMSENVYARLTKWLFALVLIVLPMASNAFDTWKDKEFSGETVYYSGVDFELVYANRGVGLGFPNPYVSTLFEEPVTLKIDNYPSKQYQVKLLAPTTLLIVDNDSLRTKIANAKRVEAIFKRCTTSSTCALSRSGYNKPIVWEFEEPLSVRFKDYLEKTQ